MSPELAGEINELFERLEKEVKDKRLRRLLARLNKHLHETSGGMVTNVNWNS